MPRLRAARVVCVALAGVLVVACSGGTERAASTERATASPARFTPIATPQPTATPTAAPAAATPLPAATATPKWDELPVAANDAAALAQQLAMLEQAIRDPSLSAAQVTWMGHLQQLAYSRLVDYPEWKDSVLAALPDQTRKAVTGSLEAGRQLRMMTGPIPKTLPDWKIVEPAPIDDLLGYYRQAESDFGVPWYYIAAIHLVETRMGRIRGLSSAGAQGPMQFIPSTWAAYGKGDVNNDHDAILAAARYLKAAGAPDNMAKAVLAYNHDDRYVKAVTAYAEVMHDDPSAYRGYHGWQVYYPTVDGPVLLPVGWKKD